MSKHNQQRSAADTAADNIAAEAEHQAGANVPAVREGGRSLSELSRPVELVNVGGFTFKVAEQVTLPVLKQKSGETVFIRIEKPIAYEHKTAEQLTAEGKAPGSKDDRPVPVLTVTDLKSGDKFKYIGNAIFVSELERQYPQPVDRETGELGAWGYVGKFFGVHKLEAREGKRYKDLQVVELIPAEGDEKAQARAVVDSTAR